MTISQINWHCIVHCIWGIFPKSWRTNNYFTSANTRFVMFFFLLAILVISDVTGPRWSDIMCTCPPVLTTISTLSITSLLDFLNSYSKLQWYKFIASPLHRYVDSQHVASFVLDLWSCAKHVQTLWKSMRIRRRIDPLDVIAEKQTFYFIIQDSYRPYKALRYFTGPYITL